MKIDKKTIIFFTKFIPAPAYDGGAMRNRAWIEFFSRKYRVIVIGFWNKRYGDSMKELLIKNDVEIHGQRWSMGIFKKISIAISSILQNQSFILKKYYDSNLQRIFDKTLREKTIDFIFCSELTSMQYVCDKRPTQTIFFDDHNVEFKLFYRMSTYANFLLKLTLKREASKIKKFEKRAIYTAQKVFAVSEEDKAALLDLSPVVPSNVVIVNNTFSDLGGYKEEKLDQKPTILFIGNLSWHPNYYGLLHFLKIIFPKIIEQVPSVQLFIVGSNLPNRLVRAVSHLPVTLFTDLGENEKEQVIDQSWVGIVPLYFASGSRIKVLELWSHGKTVVSTKIGAEGLIRSDGTRLVESNEEFITNAVSLLSNNRCLEKLGNTNYSTFKQNYFFENVYASTLYNTFSPQRSKQNT